MTQMKHARLASRAIARAVNAFAHILVLAEAEHISARSDRDFEMSLCYTPKAFSCLEEIKYNIYHCLELAPSFPKMYNITMF